MWVIVYETAIRQKCLSFHSSHTAKSHTHLSLHIITTTRYFFSSSSVTPNIERDEWCCRQDKNTRRKVKNGKTWTMLFLVNELFCRVLEIQKRKRKRNALRQRREKIVEAALSFDFFRREEMTNKKKFYCYGIRSPRENAIECLWGYWAGNRGEKRKNENSNDIIERVNIYTFEGTVGINNARRNFEGFTFNCILMCL